MDRSDQTRPQSGGEDLLERAYDILAGEGDERACDPLDEVTCAYVPRSFFLNVGNGACTKLAEQLASPGLVLAWMLGAIGAPLYLAGLLVPAREAGSLAPQLAVAGAIRRHERRKWFWVGAGVVQGLCLGAMVGAIALLPGAAAGWAVVGLLLVFSIASGVGSVAFKDVAAKTIPKGRRGRLLAMRATAGGVLALGAGLLLRVYDQPSGIAVFVVLLATAGALWWMAAGLFAGIPEPAGQTHGSRSALREAAAGWHLLRTQRGLRQFVLARGLFAIGVAIATPYYALHVQQLTSGGSGSLGLMVMAISLAAVISSPLWGRYSDASSRRVMIAAGLIGAAAGLLLLGLGAMDETWHHPLLFAVVFVILGLAQAGNRLGRKTYLVDGAPEADRPSWVAVSNTCIGLVTLLGATLGVVAELTSVTWLIGLLVVCSLAGVVMTWRMPEAAALSQAS